MSRPVLVILSSHGELAGEPNGTYLPELTHALHVLDDKGIAWTLASPKGGAAPYYGADADELTKTMLADASFAKHLESTKRLADLQPEDYAAVFYPGGYGLLFDLVDDADSKRITSWLHAKGRPVAAVCHGPAALHRIETADGKPLIEGKQVTGFTREEEVAGDTLDKVPFLLEEAMMETGATYRKKSPWQVLVVEDGGLITGQNPPSAAAVGEALARALS